MKIAIQGHFYRGNKVIQILESLGGINRMDHRGRCTNYFYYISGDDNTIAWTCVRPQHLSVFTLEEFEKEFPFKVGDKVIYDYTPNSVGTVVDIKFDDNIPYRVDLKGTICTCGTMMLKPYKEMKEERNITLALDKAKEWYKKGGELKEIALQAFNEKELNPLPRSWEEFCENYPVREGECYFKPDGKIRVIEHDVDTRIAKNWIPSKESAESYLAMIQLEQLRDCWRQGWKPKAHEAVYVINFSINGLGVYYFSSREFLSFPTREMAEEFLKCFRDLIEKAGDLI